MDWRRKPTSESEALLKELIVRHYCEDCNRPVQNGKPHSGPKFCRPCKIARGRIVVPCSWCKKDVSRQRGRTRSQTRCFCNAACLHEFNRHQPRTCDLTFECTVCHTTYTRPRSQKSRLGKLPFCSHNCVARYYSTGETNVSYIDGRTSFRQSLKRRTPYLRWRDAVYERDGHKCTQCGSDSSLHAHHLKRFSTLVDEFLSLHPDKDPKTDKYELLRLAVDYAPLWEAANGVSLCVPCHQKEHPDIHLVAKTPH